MATRESALGYCPACAAAIPRRALLASYEGGGWPTVMAECPDCDAVVHPE